MVTRQLTGLSIRPNLVNRLVLEPQSFKLIVNPDPASNRGANCLLDVAPTARFQRSRQLCGVCRHKTNLFLSKIGPRWALDASAAELHSVADRPPCRNEESEKEH